MKEVKRPFNAQKALRVACLVLADLILINLSAFLALYIRFEFDLKLLCETEFLHNMLLYSGINSVCTILIFYILKLYNSLWEFAGVSELVRTAVGCFFSAVFYMVGMFMLHLTVPRSFPAIYMLVLCLLCGAVRFLFVGRVMHEKGVDELFAAARRMKQTYGDGVEFHIVGSFEEGYKPLMDELERSGVVKYHGYQSDMKRFYAMADCVVLPSYHEGMSNVLLEAAASGRPLITSDIPGCREAVEPGVSGYLCPARDADALYAAMRRFAELPHAQRAAMGCCGRERMERQFGKTAVVAETIKHLEI